MLCLSEHISRVDGGGGEDGRRVENIAKNFNFSHGRKEIVIGDGCIEIQVLVIAMEQREEKTNLYSVRYQARPTSGCRGRGGRRGGGGSESCSS